MHRTTRAYWRGGNEGTPRGKSAATRKRDTRPDHGETRLRARVTEEIARRLYAERDRLGITTSELLRRIIGDYLGVSGRPRLRYWLKPDGHRPAEPEGTVRVCCYADPHTKQLMIDRCADGETLSSLVRRIIRDYFWDLEDK